MGTTSGSNTGELGLLRRIEELSEQNEYLKEKIDRIGTIYGGEFPAVELTEGETTEVASINVPPGTYLITGSSQINVSIGDVFVLNLNNSVRVRFNGANGGGASVSTILETAGKIFMNLYKPKGVTTPVTSYTTSLKAIRIK
ncbi:MAG: hypothetical protein HFI39_01140 [Lachnospiraceae bacterium]|nr:hypothetical protein [Lachnospiraceae bacterium]MCI8820778.1 hypothetical protein [Clostridia bacterium]